MRAVRHADEQHGAAVTDVLPEDDEELDYCAGALGPDRRVPQKKIAVTSSAPTSQKARHHLLSADFVDVEEEAGRMLDIPDDADDLRDLEAFSQWQQRQEQRRRRLPARLFKGVCD